MVTHIQAQQTDSTPPARKVAPWYVERFKLDVSFFLPVNNTHIQVGITGGAPGTPIDFQKDLGITKDIATFLASFQWRISSRSRLNLAYYDIRMNSNHVLQKEIEFKGETYPIYSPVYSFFNTAIYQFSYGYALVSKPKYELGLMIGTHILINNVGLSINGNNGGTASQTFAFNAPLPDLGIWGGYVFNNRLAANLNVDYLSLTIGDNSGTIFAYNIFLLYRLVAQLDLSIGFSGLNFKVVDTRKDFTGTLQWGYNGPSLGLAFSFGKKPWVN
jgi:hypothetical protein